MTIQMIQERHVARNRAYQAIQQEETRALLAEMRALAAVVSAIKARQVGLDRAAH